MSAVGPRSQPGTGDMRRGTAPRTVVGSAVTKEVDADLVRCLVLQCPLRSRQAAGETQRRGAALLVFPFTHVLYPIPYPHD